MNVLSLFDGMSCGQIALERVGIKVDKYYASEVDKYAIQVTQKNYPNTTQLGDVTKWREWNIDWSGIDLITGGFPCQAWSLAGKQLGDKDERGKLFWVMLDIISNVLKYNPNAKFLMENVKMKKEFEEYITLHTENALGLVYKHLINSALVSAQNRNRYYWTNINGVEQPKDKGLVLKDILEDIDYPNDYPNHLNGFYNDFQRKDLVKTEEEKSRTLLASMYKGQICSFVKKETGMIRVGTADDIKGHDSIKRIYSQEGKSPTLTTCEGGHRQPKVSLNEERMLYRKLTPIECERLQTVDDNYTAFGIDDKGKEIRISNTQRYKILGNGWTVDVIAHIFKNLK